MSLPLNNLVLRKDGKDSFEISLFCVMNFKKEARDFSGKKLTKFPQEVFSIKRLYKLDLSNNQIEHLPKEIEQLKYLETLNLSGNKIRHLKAKLFELPNLKILVLNNNEIINIPRQIKNVQHLKILHLANNKLQRVPNEITLLDNLEELNLTGNQIDFFPLGNNCFKHLKSLWLAHNPLRVITATMLITELPNLQKFYCFSPRLENKVLSADPLIQVASAMMGNNLDWLRRRYEESKVNNKINADNLPTPKVKIKKPEIFISYSHKDNDFLKRLQIHLKGLQRLRPELKLVVWDDQKIRSSHDWNGEITQALERATDAIFLVSPDFLASDFIMDKELPSLLQATMNKGVRLHSIILKPCQFSLSPLAKFQAANSPNETMIELSEGARERVYVELCGDIAYFIDNPTG